MPRETAALIKVLGNFALGRPQRDLAIAYGVIQCILDSVFRVRHRACLYPEIMCVVVAPQLERHQVPPGVQAGSGSSP